eukprot:ctg_93.g28
MVMDSAAETAAVHDSDRVPVSLSRFTGTSPSPRFSSDFPDRTTSNHNSAVGVTKPLSPWRAMGSISRRPALSSSCRGVHPGRAGATRARRVRSRTTRVAAPHRRLPEYFRAGTTAPGRWRVAQRLRPAVPRASATRGREDVAVLLIGLKRIVATVLRLYAGGVEQGEIDPTATIDEASAKGAADKKSSGGGSLSSANPFKFLSDFWSSSTKSAPVARREDPRQQAMAALVAHLTDVLEAVVAAYRAYPELRPRCEAVFIVLLPACAGDVLYAMARVARQRSLPRHEVNPSALLFLRSALELLHGSRRVNPGTCVSVVTAVWSIAARHAAAEMTPGETTATGLHVALGATLRSTSTIEANAAVAAYSARAPAGRGTSKSTGASAGRSAARALEPSRLFPAAVFSTEALRERDMDLFLLYLLQIYLRLVPADGNALAEAVVPFFTLANVVFLSSSRPWSRVVLLSATAELMARVTLDTKLVPIDVAEQIRLLLEACVPVTNGDFEVSPAAVPEGSTEGDVRSYLTARALHQLGEVVCGLCEKAFVEERTVRRRHLRNATDPAFRALKAARLTPASVAVPSVSAEVFAALCGVLPPPPITTKRRDSPPDAAAPASVLRNWSVVAATEGAWMLQHVTSAAAHPQLLLSQAAPTSDDFEWSAKALQERVVSVTVAAVAATVGWGVSAARPASVCLLFLAAAGAAAAGAVRASDAISGHHAGGDDAGAATGRQRAGGRVGSAQVCGYVVAVVTAGV